VKEKTFRTSFQGASVAQKIAKVMSNYSPGKKKGRGFGDVNVIQNGSPIFGTGEAWQNMSFWYKWAKGAKKGTLEGNQLRKRKVPAVAL